MKHRKLPLGQATSYPDRYSPDLLFAIARADSRKALGISAELPFQGVDIWNAWDLTWLGEGDVPAVATAVIRIPADSENIIESKSLKLYLNSFSMSQFAAVGGIAETLRTDLGACVGGAVDVLVRPVAGTEASVVSRLAGNCLDSLAVRCCDWEVNAGLLQADGSTIVTEDLHTHLLRSLCPVTSQPDIGSLEISYSGPKIDRASLLRYVVSYRRHSAFHEACVERMFIDILTRCKPRTLSLHARYQRRGGLDINPFRSNRPDAPLNLRLWRQ